MIDVSREDIMVMLEAGYMYLAMKKFREAKKVFEGVSILQPDHDIPHVAIANVYFAQSKFLEATRTLKKAIKLNPKSAFAYSHLGEAQLFYGKKDDAVESLKKAIELDEHGDSSQFAQSLLDLIEAGYDPKAFKKTYEQEMKNREQAAT